MGRAGRAGAALGERLFQIALLQVPLQGGGGEALAGGGDDDVSVIKMGISELGADVSQLALVGQLTQLLEQLRSDDRDAGATAQEQLDLATRDMSASNNHRRAAVKLQKDGQVIHGRGRDA